MIASDKPISEIDVETVARLLAKNGLLEYPAKSSNFQTPRFINDALLVEREFESKICRVVAITEDQRCVVQYYGDGTLKTESCPGEWSVVGHFEKDRGGLFQRLFGEPSWKFVAEDR